MKRLLTVLLLGTACVHREEAIEHSSSSLVAKDTSDDTAHATAKQNERTIETVTVAPGRETTTVEEYGPSQIPAQDADPRHFGPIQPSQKLTSVPALLRRTVTVKETGGSVAAREIEKQGTASLDTNKHSAATLAAEDESSKKTTSETRAGPGWRLWLVVIFLLLAAGGAVWKFRPVWLKWPPW